MFNLVGRKVNNSTFYWVLGGVFCVLLFFGGYHIQEAEDRGNDRLEVNQAISKIKNDINVIKDTMERSDRTTDIILKKLTEKD